MNPRTPIGVAATALTALTAVTATTAATAQFPPRDTVRLAEVVVTPTRVATARASVAASVTVLSGTQLRERGITSVVEALRDVAGVAVVQPGSFGALASVFLRGGESDHVSVLVDGVPLNQPGGAINLADLTTDNVDRIEIVRGPVSVLYGSDAVAGVVQIFTRRGRGPLRVEAAVEAGRYETATPGPAPVAGGSGRTAARWEADVAGGSEGAGYAFSVSRASTAGLYGTAAFDNSYRNTVASGLLRAMPDDRTDASLMVRYGDHTFHYPTDGAGRLTDANQYQHGTATTLGLDLGRFVLPRVEARLMLAAHTTDGGIEDAPDDLADTTGFFAYSSLDHVQRRRAEARANVYGRRGVLTVGGQLERQSQRSVGTSSSSFGNSTDRLDVTRRNHAVYAQVQADPVEAVSVNAGTRWDRSETFGGFVTYRGGVVYRPGAGLRLRATAGTGFKEPTFYENFATGFVRGNPALEPEHSTSWELGVEQTFAAGRVTMAATYFSQRFRDLIDFTFAPPAPGDPNYFNIASAESRGVELEASGAPTARLVLEGRYSYLHARVTDGGFDAGPGALLARDSALLRRPAHMVAGQVRYRPSWRLRFGMGVRHAGSRADIDYTAFERVRLPAYSVVNLSAEGDLIRTPDRTATLTLRVENLLDAPYQEAVNFPARGRTIWLGARARF
ncbi:MAG TPA: TonB-dependent receptor [Gemmatimonadales bacterium]|nr:TonB-dependent receptor [Gemmatimonadales bacterium]